LWKSHLNDPNILILKGLGALAEFPWKKKAFIFPKFQDGLMENDDYNGIHWR